MITAAPASPARSLAVRSASDVCAFVDRLPSDVAGELVFVGRSASPEGIVFVERGRICWAAARGLSRRLSDLLATSARLDATSMETLYGACKRQRAPLGEYLVENGFVTPADLRCALLAHTTESLRALCAADTSAEWVGRRRGGYNARFTFTTTELLSRSFALAQPTVATLASEELADSFPDPDWGAAFVVSPHRASPDPIAVHGRAPETVERLARLGRWASASLDVASPGNDAHGFVAAIVGDGALVAWRSGATILAGSTTLHGPARLLNRRARARRKDGSHGSV